METTDTIFMISSSESIMSTIFTAHVSTLKPNKNQFEWSEILMICHAGAQGHVQSEFLGRTALAPLQMKALLLEMKALHDPLGDPLSPCAPRAEAVMAPWRNEMRQTHKS